MRGWAERLGWNFDGGVDAPVVPALGWTASYT